MGVTRNVIDTKKKISHTEDTVVRFSCKISVFCVVYCIHKELCAAPQ